MTSLEDRLAELHARALSETDEQMAAAAGSFLERWEHDRGLGAVGARESEVTPGPGRIYRYLVVGAAAAAAVLALGVAARHSIGPEARDGLRRRASRARIPDTPVLDPCRTPLRAPGTDPLVDDFEDGNEGLYQTESRNGYWVLFEDIGRDARAPFLKPEARPEATETNRFALHASGGKLHDWGAALQVRFGPACYDVTAYRGIAFSARGPGRLRVAVGEVGVIPAEWGGTCVEDCYDLAAKPIELGARWETYQVRWDELRQGRDPEHRLDSTRVQTLSFLWQPPDTPYDVWIDDVRFLR
jgi:hypothetical protein